MSYFLFKRVLTLLATLAATSVIVFAVLEVLPGNAAQVLMGPDADPAAVAAKAVELGLDQPLLTRYGQGEPELRAKMDELMATAVAQVKAGT
mgnify:CR=1 FL=1